MQFVPELQKPLWLCSFFTRGELEIVAVVRHQITLPDLPSPVGRSISDVMSYARVETPSPTYELTFQSVMVSSVSEEFAFRDDETAIGEGAQFARYSRSKFLEFMDERCYEPDVLVGARYHYVLSCLNGRVDIVARVAPTIRLIGDTSL